MKTPTPKQIANEIAALKKCKEFVPSRTAFGDDNQEGIDAAIEVLRDNLDQSDIDERGNHEWDEEQDEAKWTPHATEQAEEALAWLNGEQKESPSSGWQSFRKDAAK